MTLQLLSETGYDRLTIDEVAARAHASKATVYRRWPSKADLVLAAFSEGIRQVVTPPDTGSLRGDLLRLAEVVAAQAGKYASVVSGILPEVGRNPGLRSVFEREFFQERKALVHGVLRRAVERGEIRPEAISEEVWDVLPGYLVFRCLVPGRPLTAETLRMLVDDVILPGLTRAG